MKIGNAPCSWGVEFAEDPRNPRWQSVLDECAGAGFEGIDLGPVGFFPEDSELLRDAPTRGWRSGCSMRTVLSRSC